MNNTKNSKLIKTLTICASVIASISLVIFLFTLNLKVTVINPDFYKNNLQKADTYNQLLSTGIPSLITNTKISEDAATNLIAQQGIIFIVQKAIPASWVQQQTENLIDQIAKFVQEPHANPVVTLKLDNLNVYTSQISDGLTVLEQIIPSCTDSQNENSQLKQLLNVSIDCKNMTYNLDDIKKSIANARDQINKVESNSVNITNEVQQAYNAFVTFQSLIKNISIYLWTSLIIFILMIVAIIYMQYKNTSALIRSLSYPFLISSIVVFIVASVAKTPATTLTEQLLTLNINSSIQNIINNLVRVSVTDLFAQLQLTSGVIALLSIVALVVTWYLFHRNKK